MRPKARYAASAAALKDCPRWNLAEVAFAGRSNAGKSSLINAVTGVKGLAHTSKTPGRTRLLNFFAVGDEFALVDLPGYGYGRMAQAEAERIAATMRDYLAARANLVGLVMVLDARRGPEAEEFALAGAIRGRGRKLLVAATKSDKLRRAEMAAALQRLRPLEADDTVLCSSASGLGLEDIRRRLLEWTHESKLGPRPARVAVQP